MAKYNLVLILEDDTEQRFECDFESPSHIKFGEQGTKEYEEFWDYHHPGTNDVGMSDADQQKFSDLYNSDDMENYQISTMYYEEA